jgi:homogentisate phytyltransferase/homogentisate geranylgeranyltransferase
MKKWWSFTRPHTIIGSAVSVTALYLVANATWELSELFLAALLAALLCNVFITGYNQLVDVDLDRINKPELPLPAGEIPIPAARAVVFTSLMISLIIGALTSVWLFALIAVIAFLGFVYSWKRVYLKKDHRTAAFAIIAVRGVLVNFGFYGLFAPSRDFPAEIWMISMVTVLFSAGIAWFKDIPDIEGDARRNIGSLAIRQGANRAFSLGFWLMGTAYTLAAFSPFVIDYEKATEAVITFGHAFLGIAFIGLAYRTDPPVKDQMKKFYLSFWGLFFLEYGLWVLAVMIN